MTAEALKRQAALEDAISEQIDRYAKRIGRISGQAKRRMVKYILAELDKADKTRTEAGRRKATARIIDSLGQKLTEAGYDTVAKELGRLHRETERVRQEYYRDLGFVPEGADLSRLADLRRQAVNGIYQSKLQLSTNLKKLVRQYDGGKLTFDKAVNEIQGSLNTAQARAYTIANTAIQAADRTTAIELGKTVGVKYWRYAGERIKSTRPFCLAILGGRHPNTGEPHPNRWTLAEINGMNNGQGLPVRENCGGYNCQHSWIPDLTRLTNK